MTTLTGREGGFYKKFERALKDIDGEEEMTPDEYEYC